MNDARAEGESPGRRGRPRAEDPRRPGATPAAEILDAAAELFCAAGYAATSTRKIADAVGMRQASLYHYFATKDDILFALLEGTVQASLQLAQQLARTPGRPLDRLIELASFDATQLLTAKFNIGALYQLPELRGERFAAFRDDRTELAVQYHAFASAALGSAEDPRAHLPFRLVESVIGLRSDGTFGGGGERDAALVAAICASIRSVLT